MPELPNLTALLRRHLDQTDGAGKTYAQRIVEAWVGMALGGNAEALKEILTRIDGPPAKPQ